jgi:gentisate 1,2-dioxygenase
MDLLDVPLVMALKAGLYEDYPDHLFPATKPVDDSLSRLGIGHLRPVGETGPSIISPLLSFPWTTTERALHELAKSDANPYDDVALEYTNPTTGGHVLPTIGCFIQMLRPGVHTKAHKHSTVTVYHVFRGRGATVVDGVRLEWEQGDFFALPPWSTHEHVNGSGSEEAVLFSCTDRPVFDSLNLYREVPYEANGGHQTVTAQYAERYGYEGAPAPARH